MELNPYAKYLGEQDARAVLAATPGLLHQAACALTPEQVEAAIAPGKWSVREIVAHMADCEVVFSFRLRQTLAEDGPVIQPFDQDKWARRYAAYSLPAGLEMFRAARGVEYQADRGAERGGVWTDDDASGAGDDDVYGSD